MQVMTINLMTYHVLVYEFCKRVYLPEVSLLLVYVVLTTCIALVGAPPIDKLDYFQLFTFPWHFRYGKLDCPCMSD